MPEGMDYIIGDRDRGPDSPVARWEANIKALRILKQLETENRRATTEEQAALGQYSGFGDGAFSQAFSPGGARDPAWARRREALESTVSKDELEGIERSRLNAFYTSPEVVKAMWKGLSDMGVSKLDRPRVLEPSAGSGRFLGLQPAEMAARSERTAVELDPLTSGILRNLYPQAKVHNAGFQAAPLPDNHFDVAVSNVPFGNYGVHDSEFLGSGRKYLTGSIHNYFFAKTLDKLRPGGVMAFVTTHHTMDAPSAQPVREYLADQADLVGAVRLPEDAFPDTDVVTDIIYLKKRAAGDQPGDRSWVETERMRMRPRHAWRDKEYSVNRYFMDNPEKVLGQHSADGTMQQADSYTVKSEGQFRPQALERETAKIGRKAEIQPGKDAPSEESAAAAQGQRHQARKYVVENGELRVKGGGEDEKPDLSPGDTARAIDLVGLKDQARRLVTLESGGAEQNDEAEQARQELRQRYDAYVVKHGEAVNTPANRQLMARDADTSLLFALEKYDAETDCWTPATILDRRVIGSTPSQQVETAGDAMAVSMNQTGRLDFERMGKQLGRSAAEVREELSEQRKIYRKPDGSGWIPAEAYLSGNVREKLKVARVAAASDPEFASHVEALEKVQPPKVVAEEIGAQLGASWIPASVVNAWVEETFQPFRPFRQRASGEPGQYFRYDDEGAEAYISKSEDVLNPDGTITKGSTSMKEGSAKGGWTLADTLDAPEAVMTSQWGTSEMDAKDILLRTLQGAPITVHTTGEGGKRVVDQGETLLAQEKAEQMQQSFNEWIWKDEDRKERLKELYNDTHNALRPRDYDGSDQTFPGMSAKWQQIMRPHQRDAIYRVVHDGTALLAHEVGFGKTASMVASAMERKRLGLANKPVFVVPKATVDQFEEQFRDLYPGANLLTPAPDDFHAGNRERFLSQIGTGDWDGVILTSEQFQRIPLSLETEAKWVRQQKAEMRSALMELDGEDTKQTRQTQKDMQKKLERFEKRLLDLQDQMQRDPDAQHFEDLGIDQLYVDEADRYKNLPYVTKMSGRDGGVKGLPQTSSMRAWDMYMKIRHLQDKAKAEAKKEGAGLPKGGIVFATGTPFANTIAETWTMMRYLQPEVLKRQGISNFDAFAKTFGVTTAGFEHTAAGVVKPVKRFARFKNMQELSNLFQNTTDIRVASEVPEMLEVQPRLDGPGGEHKRTAVLAPMHPALQDYMDDIIRRVDTLGSKDPRVDNMLKIAGDARKAALDVRMVDKNAPYNPEGKVPKAARNIAEVYRDETPDKGTQLVFLDLGTPKETKAAPDSEDTPVDDEELTGDEQEELKNVYATLKAEMVSKGVPEDQIAFIHDAKNPASRADLLDAVRAGDIRVLVGSTEKMGVGVNIQDRAAALHHIDVPWRPRDVEQREGRVIRQGNKVYGPVVDDETGEVLSPGRGVKVFQYVQEGGFDVFMWQAIETKARGIKQMMRRDQPDREMEDIDSFVISAAEMKALGTGDPRSVRAVDLGQKVTVGKIARSAHAGQVAQARTLLGETGKRLERYREMLPRLEADTQHVEGLPEGADFAATIKGMSIDKRPIAGDALSLGLKGVPYATDNKVVPLGSYKGFDLGAIHSDRGYQLVIEHPVTKQPYHSTYIDKGEVTGAGLMSRLDNLVKGIPERAVRLKGNLADEERNEGQYKVDMHKPFAKAAQLAHQERQLRVINALVSGNTDRLQEGDDINMDVMSDEIPTGPSVPRPAVATAPDVDQDEPAVEAPRAEAASALVDVLKQRADAQEKPPEKPQEKASASQVQRLQALAEIHPNRQATRLAAKAADMTREAAAEAIDDIEELIEETNDAAKIAALGRLDPENAPAPAPVAPAPIRPDPPPAPAAREESLKEVESQRDTQGGPDQVRPVASTKVPDAETAAKWERWDELADKAAAPVTIEKAAETAVEGAEEHEVRDDTGKLLGTLYKDEDEEEWVSDFMEGSWHNLAAARVAAKRFARTAQPEPVPETAPPPAPVETPTTAAQEYEQVTGAAPTGTLADDFAGRNGIKGALRANEALDEARGATPSGQFDADVANERAKQAGETAADLIDEAADHPVPLTAPGSIMEKAIEEEEGKRAQRDRMNANLERAQRELEPEMERIRDQPEDPRVAVRREIRQLGGSVPAWGSMEELTEIRDRLKADPSTASWAPPADQPPASERFGARRDDLLPRRPPERALPTPAETAPTKFPVFSQETAKSMRARAKARERFRTGLDTQEQSYLANPDLSEEEREETRRVYKEGREQIATGVLSDSEFARRVTTLEQQHERNRRQRSPKPVESAAATEPLPQPVPESDQARINQRARDDVAKRDADLARDPAPVRWTPAEIAEELADFGRRQKNRLHDVPFNQEERDRLDALHDTERAAYRAYLKGGREADYRDVQSEVTNGLGGLYREAEARLAAPKPEPKPVDPTPRPPDQVSDETAETLKSAVAKWPEMAGQTVPVGALDEAVRSYFGANRSIKGKLERMGRELSDDTPVTFEDAVTAATNLTRINRLDPNSVREAFREAQLKLAKTEAPPPEPETPSDPDPSSVTWNKEKQGVLRAGTMPIVILSNHGKYDVRMSGKGGPAMAGQYPTLEEAQLAATKLAKVDWAKDIYTSITNLPYDYRKEVIAKTLGAPRIERIGYTPVAKEESAAPAVPSAPEPPDPPSADLPERDAQARQSAVSDEYKSDDAVAMRKRAHEALKATQHIEQGPKTQAAQAWQRLQTAIDYAEPPDEQDIQRLESLARAKGAARPKPEPDRGPPGPADGMFAREHDAKGTAKPKPEPDAGAAEEPPTVAWMMAKAQAELRAAGKPKIPPDPNRLILTPEREESLRGRSLEPWFDGRHIADSYKVAQGELRNVHKDDDAARHLWEDRRDMAWVQMTRTQLQAGLGRYLNSQDQGTREEAEALLVKARRGLLTGTMEMEEYHDQADQLRINARRRASKGDAPADAYGSEDATAKDAAVPKPASKPAAKEPSDGPMERHAAFQTRRDTAALEWMERTIADGGVVIMQTGNRATRYSPKTWKALKEKGIEPVRLTKDGRLQVYAGQTKGKPRYERLLLESNSRLLAERPAGEKASPVYTGHAKGTPPSEKPQAEAPKPPAPETPDDSPAADLTAGAVAEAERIIAEAHPKPARAKRRREPKPKAEAPEPPPDPESEGVLYQGHWKAGIGDLATDNPDRRDGDGDTVVAERRPRKSDEYVPSPLPVPERIAAKLARGGAATTALQAAPVSGAAKRLVAAMEAKRTPTWKKAPRRRKDLGMKSGPRGTARVVVRKSGTKSSSRYGRL